MRDKGRYLGVPKRSTCCAVQVDGVGSAVLNRRCLCTGGGLAAACRAVTISREARRFFCGSSIGACLTFVAQVPAVPLRHQRRHRCTACWKRSRWPWAGGRHLTGPPARRRLRPDHADLAQCVARLGQVTQVPTTLSNLRAAGLILHNPVPVQPTSSAIPTRFALTFGQATILKDLYCLYSFNSGDKMTKWKCKCGEEFSTKKERDKHVVEKNSFTDKDPHDIHAPAD
jgi:hypothetical protein